MFYEQANPVNDTFIACLSGVHVSQGGAGGQAAGLLELAGDRCARSTSTPWSRSTRVRRAPIAYGDRRLHALATRGASLRRHLPEAMVVLNGYGPTFTFAENRRGYRWNQLLHHLL